VSGCKVTMATPPPQYIERTSAIPSVGRYQANWLAVCAAEEEVAAGRVSGARLGSQPGWPDQEESELRNAAGTTARRQSGQIPQWRLIVGRRPIRLRPTPAWLMRHRHEQCGSVSDKPVSGWNTASFNRLKIVRLVSLYMRQEYGMNGTLRRTWGIAPARV
jgi:hypothetical protein